MPNKIIPTPFEAIKQNNMAAFKALLEAGGNPNAEDENGNSLVEIIVEKQWVKGKRLLIQYNADFTVKLNNKGYFSKFIAKLVDEKNVALKDLVVFQKSFQEESFRSINIDFQMHQILGKIESRKFTKNKNLQIEDFTNLKLTTLNNGYIKNNKTLFKKYIEQLGSFCKFLEKNPYFTNNSVKFLLENKINQCYEQIENLIDENDSFLLGHLQAHT